MTAATASVAPCPGVRGGFVRGLRRPRVLFRLLYRRAEHGGGGVAGYAAGSGSVTAYAVVLGSPYRRREPESDCRSRGRRQIHVSGVARGEWTNGTLPGDYYGKPGAVLIAALEDDLQATLRPRMEVAGADLSSCRVH